VSENLPASTAPKGIELERLIGYRKKGLTCEEIGTLTGCTRQAVSERLKDIDLEGLDTYRDHKDAVLEHRQREIVAKCLTGDKIEKLSAYQAVGALSLLQDKIMVMRGQANNITENRNISIDLSKAYEAMKQSHSIEERGIEQNDQVIDIPVVPTMDK